MPLRHGHQPLRRPILVAGLIRHVQQNAEAARAISAVELGSQRIGKAMPHAAAVRRRPIAEKPRVLRAGRGLRSERHLLPRRKNRRIDA